MSQSESARTEKHEEIDKAINEIAGVIGKLQTLLSRIRQDTNKPQEDSHPEMPFTPTQPPSVSPSLFQILNNSPERLREAHNEMFSLIDEIEQALF